MGAKVRITVVVVVVVVLTSPLGLPAVAPCSRFSFPFPRSVLPPLA